MKILSMKTPLVVCVLAAALSSCAYAPGMYLGRSGLPERSAAEIEAEAVVPTPIDWALVRNFEAARTHVAEPLPQDAPSEYRIGPGDALRITVWNHPDLNLPPNLAVTTITALSGAVQPASNVVPHRVVAYDGSLFFPLVGKIRAAGR
ncbi:MAG: hypothetical protein GX644_14530, partial [Limnobacter sp.]|nr:hypothetical protein [Limnobacter sp.]